jgi:hypothetical protein
MRRAATAFAVLMFATLPAMAQELPQFPKAGPPEPLPEPSCDISLPNNGAWLVGRWVAPQSRWEFVRDGAAITWTLERKGGLNQDFGWQDGTLITGSADKLTGCTVHLVAGQGAFQFDGVLTDSGKIYGFATSRKGEVVRFTLRRER